MRLIANLFDFPSFHWRNFTWPDIWIRLTNRPSICGFRFLDLVFWVNAATFLNEGGLIKQLVWSAPLFSEGIFPDSICAVHLETSRPFVASVFGILLVVRIPRFRIQGVNLIVTYTWAGAELYFPFLIYDNLNLKLSVVITMSLTEILWYYEQWILTSLASKILPSFLRPRGHWDIWTQPPHK